MISPKPDAPLKYMSHDDSAYIRHINELSGHDVKCVSGSQQMIAAICDGMKALLLEKNRRYGDSALAPLRVFSKLDPSQGIRVRLDDKLARVRNGDTLRKNDAADIIGYMVLLCAAEGWTGFDDLID